jgi:hypothetical protein
LSVIGIKPAGQQSHSPDPPTPPAPVCHQLQSSATFWQGGQTRLSPKTSPKKCRPKRGTNNFFGKINTARLPRGKRDYKNWTTIFNKLPKVNNRQKGQNSPNCHDKIRSKKMLIFEWRPLSTFSTPTTGLTWSIGQSRQHSITKLSFVLSNLLGLSFTVLQLPKEQK